MAMRLGFLAFLVLFTTSTPAYAGAWVQPEGSGIFITQASVYLTDHYFDSNGIKQQQPRYRKFELQPYLEYGARDWLTVGGSFYAQAVEQSAANNYGVADPEFFARMRLYQDEVQVVSIQPLVKFASSFAKNNAVRGGSKSTDIELSALYGRNLNLLSPRDYADIRLGYRQRDRDLANQWRMDAALGVSISEHTHIIPAIRAVYTPHLQGAATFAEGGDLDYHMLKAELGGIYRLDGRQWIQASVYAPIAGAQTGNGAGLSLGYAVAF